jgi:DNA-binding CsgD family transcriptional regulator
MTAKPTFTPKQVEAMGLYIEGLRIKQIAARMDLSESAIKFHLRAVQHKLNAQSVAQASLFYDRLQRGAQ